MAGTRAQSCDWHGSGTLHPGQVLGVVCHCFPLPLDVSTFAARCLYVCNDVRDPNSERWNYGRERCPVILPQFRLPRKFRDLLHAGNLRHGTNGFTSPPKEDVLRIFFAVKIGRFRTGLNLGTKGQHTTPGAPNPLIYIVIFWSNVLFYIFRLEGGINMFLSQF